MESTRRVLKTNTEDDSFCAIHCVIIWFMRTEEMTGWDMRHFAEDYDDSLGVAQKKLAGWLSGDFDTKWTTLEQDSSQQVSS